MTAMESLTDAIAGIRLFLRGAMGADLYARYLEHMARSEPDRVPMTEREFWRDQTDRQDHNPQGRCC